MFKTNRDPYAPAFGPTHWFPEGNELLAFAQSNDYNTSLAPKKRTLDPYVTGTSVLAIKYKDGIMMSADTLGSYGSLARYRSLERMKKLGKYTLIGASGEYSDFQFLMTQLNDLVDYDEAFDDNSKLNPSEIYNYLGHVMYRKRNKFDPYWNHFIVAGFRDGQSFLGQVDLVGTTFEDVTLATGYGAYIARPLLRRAYSQYASVGGPNEQEARKILEDCMRVLFYRDARTINKIQIAKASAEGLEISEPFELETEWTHCEKAMGYPVPTDF